MRQLIILILFICTSNGFAENLNKEQLAIKQAIEQETAYFIKRDFAGWSSMWAHAPYASITVGTPDAAEDLKGWQTIAEFVKGILSDGTITLSDDVKKTDYVIRIVGDMAFAQFYENGNASTRILERHDKQWKIIHIGVVYTSIYKKNNTLITTWQEREQVLAAQQTEQDSKTE